MRERLIVAGTTAIAAGVGASTMIVGTGGTLGWAAMLCAGAAALAATGLLGSRVGTAVTTASTVLVLVPYGYLNPLVPVLTIGGYVVGWLLRSRQVTLATLHARAAQLEAEREIFAAESVQVERARIARELHDIVAHNVSVMVVQATAGQRAALAAPEIAAEALQHIASAGAQAEAELHQLVGLLDTEQPRIDISLRLIDELVARARATGLPVAMRISGRPDGIDPQVAAASYRLVQEAITNALKHAPGAPLTVVVDGRDEQLRIEVVNAAPSVPAGWSQLHGVGGTHGIEGMSSRIHAVGGEVVTGPTADGGWRVAAVIPRQTSEAHRRH